MASVMLIPVMGGQDELWLQVDQLSLVQLAECSCETNGEAKKTASFPYVKLPACFLRMIRDLSVKTIDAKRVNSWLTVLRRRN